MALRKLYPEIEPYASGYLSVDGTHTLYWEQSGNPDGVPIIYLHGGPGGCCSPKNRRYFDPDYYRIILFDQRGCGKSEPIGEVKDNTPDHLVADIEQLRQHLKIEKMHVFGGSWGSTLSLLYAIAHADRCISLIVRGIFLMEDDDIKWFTQDVQNVYPEVWEKMSNFLEPDERSDIIGSFYKRLMDQDPHVHMPAARVWMEFEWSTSSLIPEPFAHSPEMDNECLTIARLEMHFFMYHRIDPKDSILKHTEKFRHVPGTIIHGRYDMVCPLKNAYKLHKAWPEADYIVVADCGHSSSDPSMRDRLLEATDNARSIR